MTAPPTNDRANANWQGEARRTALGIRRRVLDLTIQKGGCYLSQACSAAEIFAVLYTRIMQLAPSQAPLMPRKFHGTPSAALGEHQTGGAYNGPPAAHLDRFFLSPSHYCVALYAVLIEAGRLAEASLGDFNTDGSTLEMIGAEHSPGMELTTGSFGQALSQVAGIAAARRLRGDTGNNWLFMSDGEFNEGQVWEALLFASHQKLDSIGVFVDVNGQQVDGLTRDVFNTEPLAEKLAAFGAEVFDLDGHDVEAIEAASRHIRGGKPVVVLCRTDPAKGLPVLDPRKPDLHYVAIKSPSEKQRFQAMLAELEAAYAETF